MNTRPKKFRTKINLKRSIEGTERRKELLENLSEKQLYLPKSVQLEDIDKSFIDFVKELKFEINGELVPVIFLTLQRWAEFTLTWELGDPYKHIKMPFITIIRQIDNKPGENQKNYWNIPGKRSYTFFKIPKWDGTKLYYDLYKTKQPTCVDINYEVRLFGTHLRDINRFNQLILKTFDSRQFYIFPNDHPMPIILENNSDESEISDIERRKFYVHTSELKVLGYIVDENDFEVVSVPHRTVLFTELEHEKHNLTKKITYNDNIANIIINIKPLENNEIVLKFKNNLTITEETYLQNIYSIEYYVNDVLVTLPFDINVGDTLKIIVNRNDYALSIININGYVR